MNGKGDKRRPMDEKKFREHFDDINWGHEPEPEPEQESPRYVTREMALDAGMPEIEGHQI
jgi:hypothetical protein